MSKKPARRIKDLPPDESLTGVRFKYPKDGKPYYWVSQWQKGVWGKRNISDNQVFPLFCDDLAEALEWEVLP